MSVGWPQDQLAKNPVSGFGGSSAFHGRLLPVLVLFRGRYLVTLQKYPSQRFSGGSDLCGWPFCEQGQLNFTCLEKKQQFF